MRGGMGLMGEAGPEAIMPLTRGADGRLGVAGGGRRAPVNVSIERHDAGRGGLPAERRARSRRRWAGPSRAAQRNR